MKYLYYLLAICAMALMVQSIRQLSHKEGSPAFNKQKISANLIETNDPAYSRLVTYFQRQADAEMQTANKNGSLSYTLTLIMTVLTAGSALISGIRLAVNDPGNPRPQRIYAIIVAVMTFLATITMTVAGHYTELKTDAMTKSTAWAAVKSAFRLEYANAQLTQTQATITAKYLEDYPAAR